MAQRIEREFNMPMGEEEFYSYSELYESLSTLQGDFAEYRDKIDEVLVLLAIMEKRQAELMRSQSAEPVRRAQSGPSRSYSPGRPTVLPYNAERETAAGEYTPARKAAPIDRGAAPGGRTREAPPRSEGARLVHSDRKFAETPAYAPRTVRRNTETVPVPEKYLYDDNGKRDWIYESEQNRNAKKAKAEDRRRSEQPRNERPRRDERRRLEIEEAPPMEDAEPEESRRSARRRREKAPTEKERRRRRQEEELPEFELDEPETGRQRRAGASKSKRSDALFYIGLVVLVSAALLINIFSGSGVRTVLGFSAFIVKSSSMEDVYPKDSLIVTRRVNPDKLAVGDDITFFSNETTIITHRVVGIYENYEETGERGFETKGTKNENPDKAIVPAVNVIGKVILCSGFIGALALFVGKNWPLVLFFVAVIIVMTIVVKRILKS